MENFQCPECKEEVTWLAGPLWICLSCHARRQTHRPELAAIGAPEILNPWLHSDENPL